MTEAILKQKTESETPRRIWWHWQNLNDRKGDKQGSGLRHGRAWMHFPLGSINWGHSRTVELCWKFFSHFCGAQLDIGDENVTIMLALPPVALWFSLSTNWAWINRLLPRKPLQYYPETIVIDERECGISVHSGMVWIKPWCKSGEWTRDDPWWVRGVSFSVNPFEWRFMRHEVRMADGSWALMPPCSLGAEGSEPHAEEIDLPYAYLLKSGELQHRNAAIKVERRAWRPRCLRWTSLFEKVRTCIDVRFSDEVGERSGLWKGGCIGCGYDMLPGETADSCLRRMERERKF